MQNGNCKLENHGLNPYNFLCVDAACKHPQKFACLGCMAFHHPNHKTVQYSEVYANINKMSGESKQEQNGESLSDFLEQKRKNMMIDLTEAIKYLDLMQFGSICDPVSNSSSSSQNLQNQYQKIQGKPFHSMNGEEINLVINLYNQSKNNPQGSQSAQNQTFEQNKTTINVQYQKNKKSILNFVNCYREQIEEGQEPQNYSDILKSSKVIPKSSQDNSKIDQLQKEIAKLEEQLAPLKNRNKYLEDELQLQTVKFQSVKEQNEALKTRLQQQQITPQQQQQTQNLATRVSELQSQLNITNSNYNSIQTKFKQVSQENDELKEVLIKAKLALEIYDIKFKQLTEALEKNKRESAFQNLRAAIIEAQQDERRKQEMLQRQRQQGRVEVTECNVQ